MSLRSRWATLSVAGCCCCRYFISFYRKINWLISFTHYTYHLRQEFTKISLTFLSLSLVSFFVVDSLSLLMLAAASPIERNVCLHLIGLTLMWLREEKIAARDRKYKHRTTITSHNSQFAPAERRAPRWFDFSAYRWWPVCCCGIHFSKLTTYYSRIF